MHTVLATAVIPTKDRAESLSRTLDSLLGQGIGPAQLIVVDASDDDATKSVVQKFSEHVATSVTVGWFSANISGAAAQRNQGVSVATQNVIWFLDDDIVFEPQCVERLWQALQSDPRIGGVNAMITNQSYGTPGAVSRFMFRLMNGKDEPSYAGRLIGPAVNLLPQDRDDLPEVVPVEWLNTTCTMYRREALPDSPFPAQFTGYSLMEDVALSLEVGKRWKLANARTARIFHDSQPADYKSDQRLLSCMQLTNRHFVMTQIMNQRAFSDHFKLLIWEMFSLASMATGKAGRVAIGSSLAGKVDAFLKIISRQNAEQ